MKTILATAIFVMLGLTVYAQPTEVSALDLVLTHPDVPKVKKVSVPYMKNNNADLHLDLYLPPGVRKAEQRPAVIFFSLFTGFSKLRYFESWAKLAAANGMVGVVIESDENVRKTCLQKAMEYINTKGNTINVDANRLGIYSEGHVADQMGYTYLASTDILPGIKSAVFFSPAPNVTIPNLTKKVAVHLVVCGFNSSDTGYSSLWDQIQKEKLPWTLKFATGMPYHFEVLVDTDESRRIIKEAIDFWKNNLEAAPASNLQYSMLREYFEAQKFGDSKKAQGLLTDWLKTRPTDLDAQRINFSMLKSTGRFSEAESIYNKYLRNVTPDANLTVDYAVVLFGLNKTSDAEKYISSAGVKLDWYHYRSIARGLGRMKKHPESVKYYQKAAEMQPEGQNFYNLACSYALTENKNKAFENLEKSITNGFNSKKTFESDSDLSSLRSDERWPGLLQRLTN